MKPITTILFVLIIFLASCGDDTITNNGGNTEQTLLTIDSLVLTMNPSHPNLVLLQPDSDNLAADTTIKTIRISYTLKTNFNDSAEGGYSWRLSMGNYELASSMNQYTGNVDTTYIRTFNLVYPPIQYNTCFSTFVLNIQYNNSSVPVYLKLTNIKIEKI